MIKLWQSGNDTEFKAMTAALPISLTLEAFLKLPETQPASEFINGRIHQKSMPQGKHSRLQLKFCNAVNLVAEAERIALAFPELRCTFGGRSIVPDATVFAWDRITFEADGEVPNSFEIHPDWTVEILSPDQKATKVISNILHCLKYGTQLGWLVDPEERFILAFIPGREPVELTGQDRLPVPSFLTLDFTVEQVFGWLKAGG
ncbi:Uma2 family endonuclease [Microcoleus sp. B4-C5]|uniref:Uma2 family endonuclease n=1 Tax=unclassified Microcoleus TaxID=2642155 RepID=UPI002FD27173